MNSNSSSISVVTLMHGNDNVKGVSTRKWAFSSMCANYRL